MIPLAKPWFDDREAAAVAEVLESGWVTQGPRVAEFERVVAEFCGAAHAVAVTSCTVALRLALVSLGVGPDDEIICPSWSFIATANAIVHAGAQPVFADIDRATYNLDPASVEQSITPRTRAIVLVHQFGLPAELDRFRRLASERGLWLLEDAACALGSTFQGRPIGAGATAACLSFHPRKVITTGEGGMILTDDAALAARMRLLRQHAMSTSDLERHGARRLIVESYAAVGYNDRMTDLQAAVGLAQMEKLEAIISRRRALAARYDGALAGHPWLAGPTVPTGRETNYQSYSVRVQSGCPISRDAVVERLLAMGIGAKRGIAAAHREPAYNRTQDDARLPETMRAADEVLLLPLWPQMSTVEQDEVLRALESLGCDQTVECAG